MISGAELVVKALIDEKVDVCFAYPGGQAIDLFDALYQRKEFRVILPRHEQGLIRRWVCAIYWKSWCLSSH